TRHCHETLALLLLFMEAGLSLLLQGWEIWRYEPHGLFGSAAVGDGQDVLQVQGMTGRPFRPQSLDYPGGVNQRAIKIKKKRITHQFA
ncbi:MAG TPA: hypothetical protein VED66_12730, partial [Candidatus Sulfotelmatobacter sp.]|nr:hypothetical protein [Candidatus Sulfotelmatobacter sp.]